jgi:hypothetical protein
MRQPNGELQIRNKAKRFLREEVTFKLSADSKFFVQFEVCSCPEISNT